MCVRGRGRALGMGVSVGVGHGALAWDVGVHVGVGVRVRTHHRPPRAADANGAIVPGLPKKALYLVKFKQKDVWESYEGSDKDSIAADIYEHWLKLYK